MAARWYEIAETLRCEIAGGVLGPGQQLPNRLELTDRFKAGPWTVARAVQMLVRAGFLRTSVPEGTFVVDHPPHLHSYGLVFPGPAEQCPWSLHWQSLRTAAAEVQATMPGRIRVYEGLIAGIDTAQFERLRFDLEHECVAGVLFARTPRALMETGVLKTEVPCLSLMCDEDAPGLLPVDYDHASWREKCLDRLAARGCRRPALLVTATDDGYLADIWRHWEAGAAARGMEARRQWMLGVPFRAPTLTRNLLQVLMDRPADERPDGLCIMDDNLVEEITGALASGCVKGAEDLEIVALTTFGSLPTCHLPVYLVGFDARETIPTCIAAIDAIKAGGERPRRIMIPARTRDEVAASQ